MNEPIFYTTDELARILKLNVMTIYRYIKRGTLSAYKLGKTFRIDSQELERLLSDARIKSET